MSKNIIKMDTSTNAGLPHYSVDEEAYESGTIFTAGEVEFFDVETTNMIDSMSVDTYQREEQKT